MAFYVVKSDAAVGGERAGTGLSFTDAIKLRDRLNDATPWRGQYPPFLVGQE